MLSGLAVYPIVGEFWLLSASIPGWRFPSKIVRVERGPDEYGILLVSVVGMKGAGDRRIHKKWFYVRLIVEEYLG